MRYWHSFFIILILLISCEKRENVINNFTSNNNISLVNVSKEIIDGNTVLRKYDDSFLKEYGFTFSRKADGNFDINDIKYIKSKNNKVTKISEPVFSKDSNYCLIQIIVYFENIEESDTTYLLENNSGKWGVKDRMVKYLSH